MGCGVAGYDHHHLSAGGRARCQRIGHAAWRQRQQRVRCRLRTRWTRWRPDQQPVRRPVPTEGSATGVSATGVSAASVSCTSTPAGSRPALLSWPPGPCLGAHPSAVASSTGGPPLSSLSPPATGGTLVSSPTAGHARVVAQQSYQRVFRERAWGCEQVAATFGPGWVTRCMRCNFPARKRPRSTSYTMAWKPQPLPNFPPNLTDGQRWQPTGCAS